ncbi:LIM domain protein [Teladorsagia circumcincta]|uniref:LIM domain protein n=1 Tax=Teladorsagia circumcincta TaxID=45464 RepID=A0A2G9UY71_TELCI|nr:LIM domain protein [Teladorsagia circumcincta]
MPPLSRDSESTAMIIRKWHKSADTVTLSFTVASVIGKPPLVGFSEEVEKAWKGLIGKHNLRQRASSQLSKIASMDKVDEEKEKSKSGVCSVPFDEGEICVIASRVGTQLFDVRLADGDLLSALDAVDCCADLIFGDECTEAEGRTWHHHHFQCADCSKELGGQKYMQRNNKPVCLGCFHSNGSSSLTCTTCNGAIPLDQPHISQSDLSWHADQRCFCCSVCSKNLLGKKYSLVNKNLYCGYKTCGGEDELFEEDRIATSSSPSRKVPHSSVEHQRRKHHSVEGRALRTPMRIPSSPRAPRPPQRAPPPPPPPAENIYETVLPSTALRIESHFEHETEGRYTRTPSKTRRQEEQHGYSTSSSDSEDDAFYINKLLVAASLNRKCNRGLPPLSTVKTAKTKKSNRCIVS